MKKPSENRKKSLNSKSLLDQARKNVLNACADMDALLHFAEAWQRVGFRIFDSFGPPENKEKFNQGVQMMRDALYAHQSEQIRRCFYLVGTADEEMKTYVMNKMGERLNGDFEIMSFLNEYGYIPSCFKTEDEENFRKEIREAIEKTTK